MFCCDSPWLLILSFMVDWFCSQTTTQLLSVGTTQLLFFAWYLAKYTFFNTNVPFTSIYIPWTEGAVSYEPIFWREYFFAQALCRYVRHLQISYCTWNALVHKTGVLSPKITHRSRHSADSTPLIRHLVRAGQWSMDILFQLVIPLFSQPIGILYHRW